MPNVFNQGKVIRIISFSTEILATLSHFRSKYHTKPILQARTHATQFILEIVWMALLANFFSLSKFSTEVCSRVGNSSLYIFIWKIIFFASVMSAIIWSLPDWRDCYLLLNIIKKQIKLNSHEFPWRKQSQNFQIK